MAYLLEVRLAHHDTGPLGWYSPSLQTISTRRGLTIADYKSTLAHELGHAVYRDQHTGHGHFDRKQETRADRFAARLLIDPEQLATSAAFYRDNLPAIANDLDITPHLLRIYLSAVPERTTHQ